ncbi:hypothetical protein A0H81_03670 [Grifola frondosa]|uniref:Uncharacterized protein n=1 Tax=Grifola frondosa TaxID=5627 RepID=A0A1C7MJD1_GRIFR|nr:hypothetical protein A0H81_03670 [Grifola frondosa]
MIMAPGGPESTNYIISSGTTDVFVEPTLVLVRPFSQYSISLDYHAHLFVKFRQQCQPELRQVEKMVAKETKADQKNLDHTIKDLRKAEKSHNDSIKTDYRWRTKPSMHLTRQLRKHDAANALNRAVHHHDAAVSDQHTAEKTLELKRQHEARLREDLEKRRSTMEEFRQRKASNDSTRETKLSQLHAQAASRANTMDAPAGARARSSVEYAAGPGDATGGATQGPTTSPTGAAS